MLKKLYAICLLVEDFERSFLFYKNTLGLKVNFKKGKFADFKLGEISLAIFEKNEARSMFSKDHMNVGGSAVFAFQVNDIQKTCRGLKSKGVEIFEGPKTTPWGQTVAYFNDPDNNVWEIILLSKV